MNLVPGDRVVSIATIFGDDEDEAIDVAFEGEEEGIEDGIEDGNGGK